MPGKPVNTALFTVLCVLTRHQYYRFNMARGNDSHEHSGWVLLGSGLRVLGVWWNRSTSRYPYEGTCMQISSTMPCKMHLPAEGRFCHGGKYPLPQPEHLTSKIEYFSAVCRLEWAVKVTNHHIIVRVSVVCACYIKIKRSSGNQ